MDLKGLLTDESATMAAIADALDAASPEERREAAHSLNRSEQRSLYRRASASRPLTLADFVPAEHGPRVPVRHFGRNTLLLPKKLQFFEKRLCRPETGAGRLFGYNQSPFIGTIGPGFFLAVETTGNAAWEERGAIVVDYLQVPDGPVAPEWPRVIPNTRGLQIFVYHRTRDFMRRVSSHVTIGAAFRMEKALDHYFVLVREP